MRAIIPNAVAIAGMARSYNARFEICRSPPYCRSSWKSRAWPAPTTPEPGESLLVPKLERFELFVRAGAFQEDFDFLFGIFECCLAAACELDACFEFLHRLLERQVA